jgi:hypothetical protein
MIDNSSNRDTLTDFRNIQISLPLYLLIASLVFLVFDFNSTLSGAAKYQYLPLLAMLLIIAKYANMKKDKPAIIVGTNKSIVLYLTYGITGILVGKLYLGAVNGPLPLIAPFIILLFASKNLGDRKQIEWASYWISILCLGINILIVATRIDLVPYLSLFQFSHENSYIIPIGLGCALIARRKSLLVFQLISIVMMYLVYPAGTYVLTYVLALIFFGMYKLIAYPRVLGFLLSSIIAIEIYFIHTLTFRFSDLYQRGSTQQLFSFLGKADNSVYRKFLQEALLINFYDSPIYGQGFLGEVLVVTRSNSLPVHNDYLTILVAGGTAALVFFGSYLLSIYWRFFRILPLLSPTEVKLAFALLSAVNVYQVSCAINPLTMKMSHSLIYVSLLYVLQALFSSKEKR